MIHLSSKVGWLYKDKLLLELVFTKKAEENISVLGSYFSNITLAHKEVKVTVNQRTKTYQTDAFGNLILELKGLKSQDFEVILEIKGKKLTLNSAEFYHIEPLQEFIISDIDDTVLRSHTLYPLKQLFYTLMPVRTRKVIPNVQKFLISMAAKGKTIVFVSNSSMNLKSYLLKFMARHEFPKGPILLNDFQSVYSLIKDKLKGKKHVIGYKMQRIERLMTFLDDCRFGLIGDNSQQDPEVFLSVAKQFEDRVNFIAVRKAVLTSADAIEEMYSQAGEKIYLFDDNATIDLSILKEKAE